MRMETRERSRFDIVIKTEADIVWMRYSTRGFSSRSILLTTAALAVSLTTAVCGGSPTEPSRNAATLTVQITDSPYSDAEAVLVTFSEVAVHRADDEWSTLPFADSATTRTCDLRKLEGAQDVLGAGALSPGHYTQIRLVATSATLYFENASAGPACAPMITPPAGESAQLEIPSDDVKLNHQFELTANDAMTILLDFDGDRSINATGNDRYIMTPVIGIASVQ